MYKTITVCVIVFMIMLVTAQFAKREGYYQATEEINLIGSYAHNLALKTAWPNNDYYTHPHNAIKVVVKAEVDKVIPNMDMRYDDLSVILGGQLYLVRAIKHKDYIDEFKKGQMVDVYMELKYEPISNVRDKTILSISEMRVN